MFFPGHIGSDASVNQERASGLVENCCMARKAEVVGADTVNVQVLQTAEIIGVDPEEGGGDLAVVGAPAERVDEAVVGRCQGVVVEVGRRPRLLWLQFSSKIVYFLTKSEMLCF